MNDPMKAFSCSLPGSNFTENAVLTKIFRTNFYFRRLFILCKRQYLCLNADVKISGRFKKTIANCLKSWQNIWKIPVKDLLLFLRKYFQGQDFTRILRIFFSELLPEPDLRNRSATRVRHERHKCDTKKV